MNQKVAKRNSVGLGLLIVVQAAAALFFLSDIAFDLFDGHAQSSPLHLAIEGVAALSLAVSVVVGVHFLLEMLRRQARLERGLSVASGALNDLMETYFHTWGLTPSEQDVATFAIKGVPIAEIAVLRGSAEGTVKAHLNAIYRKAGVSGRGELVSLLIEDLMTQPLLRDRSGQTAAE
ncbi:helix-turn-helix transcriptional regulator [Thalassovita sp.]|uniref:helix-turn-helix transcriptional regulator n=1 Tax=Thalassovita sp. TaxID=1979401 RepID=UPI0029DE87CD|nr:helix-turn-helix transcriptional regulator [Thalassovita sp.]